jgi:hypothetical protein
MTLDRKLIDRGYVPCPYCPHWLHLHDSNGQCLCGATHDMEFMEWYMSVTPTRLAHDVNTRMGQLIYQAADEITHASQESGVILSTSQARFIAEQLMEKGHLQDPQTTGE